MTTRGPAIYSTTDSTLQRPLDDSSFRRSFFIPRSAQNAKTVKAGRPAPVLTQRVLAPPRTMSQTPNTYVPIENADTYNTYCCNHAGTSEVGGPRKIPRDPTDDAAYMRAMGVRRSRFQRRKVTTIFGLKDSENRAPNRQSV